MSEDPQNGNAFRIKWGRIEFEGRGRDIIQILVILFIGGTLTWYAWISYRQAMEKIDAILANQTIIMKELGENYRIQREGDAGIIYILSLSPEERGQLKLQEPDAVRKLRR